MNPPALQITGTGQPLIWLHGMLNSVESDSVYSLVNLDQLSELACLIRYNVCDKSFQGDYSWEASTNELFEVIQSQNLDSLILGGCSMGSGTAIHAAVRFPERVKALILVTPPPAWEMRTAIRSIYHKIASKADQPALPEFVKRLIGLHQDPPDFYEQHHPGTRERLQAYRLSFDPRYYAKIYRGGAVSDLPKREQIATINVPTLIVSVLNDQNHPFEMARQLNSLLKSSELFTVSDYSDYLNLQKKVSDFIGSVTSANNS